MVSSQPAVVTAVITCTVIARATSTGAWRNPESGEVEYDDSWRYEVGIDPADLDELDEYLARLSHRLRQKALWRVVYAGGAGKVIPARAPAKR